MNLNQEPVNEPWQVPSDWEWCHIGNVCDVVSGSTPSTSNNANFDNGEIAWITPADLSGYKNKFIANGARNITEQGLASCAAKLLPKGTVLFSSRAPIGYVAIAENPLTTNQGFKNFLPSERVKPDYLYYYLQFAKPLAVKMASGTTFLEISGKNAARIPLAIPPLIKQQGIVYKIEELFSDLDAGVAALKRAQANLKRYRAAVLKAAVEGRLTAQWRAERKAKGIVAEPAAKLLERILAERRKKWEAAQLKKYTDAGKAPPKGWQEKYVEPAAPDANGLTELPEGWCWANIEQAGEVQLGRQRSPKNVSKDFPTKYLRAANLTDAGLDLSDVLEMEFSPREKETFSLKHGDLILSEASGSPNQVGKPAIWRNELDMCCFQNTVIRLRPAEGLSEFLLKIFQAFYLSGVFARTATGVGINHLCAYKFAKISVPLGPLVEQTEIVSQVEAKLSCVFR